MRAPAERCRPWIPTPFCQLRPPTFRTRTLVDGEFFSSSAYFVRTRNLSPWNFSGQWHCSQVSRAGRRCLTGDGMGREYVPSATAKSCRVPESFERTNQDAPDPMWHSTQATREWGEFRYAVYSGAITVWQVVPQNWTESMCSTAL